MVKLKAAAALLAVASLYPLVQADNVARTDGSVVTATGGPIALPPQEGRTTPVDVGRQLFVDDYLVSKTTLTRSFHKPDLCEKNPMLKPETAAELDDGFLPVAAPFNDGAWYEPKDNLFKGSAHESDEVPNWRRVEGLGLSGGGKHAARLPRGRELASMMRGLAVPKRLEFRLRSRSTVLGFA
jgi:hypothetical protein